MKKVILFSLAVGLIAALVFMSVTPGLAKAAKVKTCALQTNTAEIPGKVWVSDDGTVLHIRGQKTYGVITPLAGHPECDPVYSSGTIESIVNINLNLVTLDGNAYGTHTIQAENFEGSWVGSFSGPIEDGLYFGKAISMGTGELEGMMWKVNIVTDWRIDLRNFWLCSLAVEGGSSLPVLECQASSTGRQVCHPDLLQCVIVLDTPLFLQIL